MFRRVLVHKLQTLPEDVLGTEGLCVRGDVSYRVSNIHHQNRPEKQSLASLPPPLLSPQSAPLVCVKLAEILSFHSYTRKKTLGLRSSLDINKWHCGDAAIYPCNDCSTQRDQ